MDRAVKTAAKRNDTIVQIDDAVLAQHHLHHQCERESTVNTTDAKRQPSSANKLRRHWNELRHLRVFEQLEKPSSGVLVRASRNIMAFVML